MDSRGRRQPRLSAQIPQQQGRRGKNGEIPTQKVGAEQRSPAREACLLTRRGGRGLGAEARALVLAGRESGKKSAAAEEARDIFLPLCFMARKERGFRAPPKRAPETGASLGDQRGPQRWARAAAISADPRGGREPRLTARTPETGVSRSYQRGHQTWAGDAKAAAAATKKPVCEHRSLSTPPLLGACAARHCQGPVIQGQLRWVNARRASGCCNVTLASAAAGSPRLLRTTPSPRPE